ncbi:MAG: hypothetical protein HY362_02295 [Candidatus Aenigmarchaeota archaeon]|nr:hypothetical protein [Candidatus Aenigmarchaeota archaeon]
MAEFICLVKEGAKAEDTLRKDFDLAAKQSITVRESSTLGLKTQGTVIFVRGSEEGVSKCKELLKPFLLESKSADLEAAKMKILEGEEKALEGFGGIFG